MNDKFDIHSRVGKCRPSLISSLYKGAQFFLVPKFTFCGLVAQQKIGRKMMQTLSSLARVATQNDKI